MAVSPEVKLEIYNNALGHLGSGALASLAENRKPRRVMDRVWGPDNRVVKYALSRGEWNFGIRTVMADYDDSIDPAFGFQRAFIKPDDCVRLAGLSANDRFSLPLDASQFTDEANYWFSDCDVLYIKFVSNADTYGMDSSRWSESFRKYIELHMADEACEEITNSTAKKDRLQRDALMMLKEARSSDAMQEGVKFLPAGSWIRSRSQWNRGSRNG